MRFNLKYIQSFLCSFFLILCGLNSQSQSFFVSFFAGSSNYSGDLQEKRFTFTQAHPAIGVGFVYELNPKMLIRADYTTGKISADDQYSSKNKARNLSFFTNISEYSIGFEYNLLNMYDYRFSPYLFTGVALFDYNPYTKDVNDNVIFLAELSTEGQGFIPGKKEYKLRQFSIPLGGGLQWAINNNKRLGFVIGFRKTFTDYIDDVSTTYVDETTLALNRGQRAVNVAFREDDINSNAVYPVGGSQRGSPKSKDSYYFGGLTFRVRIAPKGRTKKYRLFNYDTDKSRRSRLECPTRF